MKSGFKKKHFEGLTTCFGVPLGNSVNKYRIYEASMNSSLESQIKEFTIVSVGVKTIKHTQSVRLSIDGSACANYFGYHAFPTKKDAEDFLHKHQLVSDIKHNSDFSKLSYKEVLDLHKKVFIKLNSQFSHIHIAQTV